MIATAPIHDRSAHRFDQVALLLFLLVSAGLLSVIAWQFAAAILAIGAWWRLGSRRTRAGSVSRCAGCGADAGACFCDHLITHQEDAASPPARDRAA